MQTNDTGHGKAVPFASEVSMYKAKAGWVARMYDVAGEHGFLFEAGEIGKWLKPLVDRLGEEKVLRAWTYWITNAIDLGEPPHRMNPKAFVRAAGHWLHLSNPVVM